MDDVFLNTISSNISKLNTPTLKSIVRLDYLTKLFENPTITELYKDLYKVLQQSANNLKNGVFLDIFYLDVKDSSKVWEGYNSTLTTSGHVRLNDHTYRIDDVYDLCKAQDLNIRKYDSVHDSPDKIEIYW